MTNPETEYTRHYFLTAAECDATGHLPLTLVFERLIEVATEHANLLHIGFADLLPYGVGWVLTRVSVKELAQLPYNSHYTITTWVEDINRRFSNRCFVICDGAGKEIIHARTMWVTINFESREAGNLDMLSFDSIPISDRICPIRRYARIPQLPASALKRHYTFRYCDIDVNRHVNTVRYIALILNSWDLEWFDSHRISEFDIAFHHECKFGQQVQIRILENSDANDPMSPASSVCEIVHAPEADADGVTPDADDSAERALSVAITWTRRPQHEMV